MKKIDGGVCAAKGFYASGVHCGIRENRTKRDVSLIYSEVKASAAAVYTTNLVKGAPIEVTKSHLIDGYAQACICNSGNANTCNSDGVMIAEKTCDLLAQNLKIPASDIVIASTGVIGQHLSIEPFKRGIPELVSSLSKEGYDDAVEGIMTTDTVKKQVAFEFEINGKTCRIGGMAKGSGMIHPALATMLVFITTDVSISPDMLRKALSGDVQKTFNMVSIDGDTSTNDTVVVLANGLSGNPCIDSENDDFSIFMKALNSVTVSLCKMIASDGEGASKMLDCRVVNASDDSTAAVVAKSIICSSLVKAAMFGADANWGRVLCAIGYSGADVDVTKIDVSFTSEAGTVSVCKNGSGIDFSEEIAKKVLSEKEIVIDVSLNSGNGFAEAWGCDLTYDYVKINGDYRT